MSVTPLYAALLTFLFVALSIRTLRLRRRLGIGLGDGQNEQILRAMRAHANFAEYVPLCLVLLFMLEALGAPAALLHALGCALLIGRCSHAFGVSRSPENYRYRVIGMALTFLPLLGAAAALLALTLS
jgi:uncharacterized membrane protein YecN with MAPEG domain